MATVTSYTQAKIDELVAALVATGGIDDDGNLTLTTQGGTVINLGTVLESMPIASETVTGGVELAADADVTTGTDDTKAVTPLKLANALAPINTAVAGKQTSNTNLNAISGLNPASGDVMQYEGTSWSHRTVAQLATDLIAAAPLVEAQLYSGSAYAAATGAQTYVGATDPGSAAANGSVWFDTSGS